MVLVIMILMTVIMVKTGGGYDNDIHTCDCCSCCCPRVFDDDCGDDDCGDDYDDSGDDNDDDMSYLRTLPLKLPSIPE